MKSPSHKQQQLQLQPHSKQLPQPHTHQKQKHQKHQKHQHQQPAGAELEIVPTGFDFGVQQLSEPLRGTFVIKNNGERRATFALFLDQGKGHAGQGRATFDVFNGTISSKSERTISFSYTPKSVGQQQYVVTVRNVITREAKTFTISVAPRGLECLRFLNCPPAEGSTIRMDVGACYWQAAQDYVRVYPLSIESLSEVPVLLSSSSTMTSQLFIFADKELKTPCDEIEIAPRGTLNTPAVVYICLKPNIPVHVLRSGECRPIEAGIHFRVTQRGASPDDFKPLLARYTVKFRAVVGRSTMKVRALCHTWCI
jgi:hypothetical protein